MPIDLYKGSRKEIDLRSEFNSFLDGSSTEIAKAQIGLLRKIRFIKMSPLGTPILDSVGNQIIDYIHGSPIKCECVDSITGEPDLDTFCPICLGEGYLFDEFFIKFYKKELHSSTGRAYKEELIAPGLVNIPIVTFYIKSKLMFNKHNNLWMDKVVELIKDVEGNLVRPYARDALYRIATAVDYRSDNGRIEYWQANCFMEERKFLNGRPT